MKTMNEYCIEAFGEKLYKLPLSTGFSCPNRDGTKGVGGCIFCSGQGSGDFAEKSTDDVDTQIEKAKLRVSNKFKGTKYIAYFQSFTSTYGPVEKMREMFFRAAKRDDIAVVSIATRPDCLPDEVLELLCELQNIKPVWVELGLQTAKEESIRYIRRGYENYVYEEAIKKLNDLGIHTITHVILGLPGETEEDMYETVRYAVENNTAGIKLQLLHVLRGTDLAKDYEDGKFKTLELEEYAKIVANCVRLLPGNVVVHRLTGDGAKKDLIAPLWSGDKKRVMNRIKLKIDNE